jgi:AraC-like DNA-binding protein
VEEIVIDEGLGVVERISQRLVARTAIDHPSAVERRLRWEGPDATGHASCSNIRAGLSLMWVDARANQPWAFDLLHEPTGLQLAFARSCGASVTNDSGVDVGLQAGHFGLFKLHELARLSCRSVEAPEQSVRLMLDPQHLLEMLGEDCCSPLIDPALGQTGSFSSSSWRMTAEMYAVLDALSTCGMTGPLRQLYVESKALELIALAVSVLDERATSPSDVRQDADFIERLEYARALLVGDICEPPSLRQLARCCGLNERKLKEGFKLRFGTTVFAFVREQRMKRAHGLLLRGSASVGEVAQSVGYSNPSKFAAAFRRQFGISPSAVGAC